MDVHLFSAEGEPVKVVYAVSKHIRRKPQMPNPRWLQSFTFLLHDYEAKQSRNITMKRQIERKIAKKVYCEKDKIDWSIEKEFISMKSGVQQD